jgi:methyl-accepting chemotaxis protein
MRDVVESVARVAAIMGDIMVATHAQTDDIGQIDHAITEADRMTQQNGALVEEVAAASASMKEQAALLAEAVDVFRLGTTSTPRPPALGTS